MNIFVVKFTIRETKIRQRLENIALSTDNQDGWYKKQSKNRKNNCRG
jgi:hypothetical protein